MRVQVLLLLLGAALAAATSVPFVEVPPDTDDAECWADSETDRWKKDCNWCSCKNGKSACTRKLCRPGRVDEGPECQGNPTWMDDCNTCSCHNGQAGCTFMLCDTHDQVPDEPDCWSDSETDRWRKDCNWCSCRNGRETCTRRLCPEGIVDDGPKCEGNATWMEDCNTCFCNNGQVACTFMLCVQPDPQVTVETKTVNAQCEDGSRWRIDCNWCTCENGVSHCTQAACGDWNENQAQEEGIVECHGASRWKKDCNWCSCVNGRGACTEMACIPPERDPFRNLPEDAVCVPGSRWLDVCNWCTCSDTGVAGCTFKGCLPGYVHEGPTCEDGAVWKSDDCNICRCIDGASVCTKRLCGTPFQGNHGEGRN